ncbi:MAG: alanine racemase [Woeseiaceae bacterium]
MILDQTIPTRAVISLSACQHNLSIAQQAAPDSKNFAIIKANAYGHGMVEIAKSLTKADGFGVARIQESITLREAGITQSILLLEGFSSSEELELIEQQQLDCVVHSEIQINLLEQFNTHSKKINIVVKVDTGMHRLGFSPDELRNIVQRLEKCDCVQQSLTIMTHFACADDKQDQTTLNQIKVLDECLEALNITNTSMANSAGILGWPQSHASYNRPGIMLYGVSPFLNLTAKDHNLQPVMTLKSKLVSVKKVKQGEAIGYGATYRCEKDLTIGIVAIGYGDGYPRHAKTGTPVVVNGKRCALLGRVSMDMICVDLSAQENAKVNDDVVLWGDEPPIEEIAEAADTIAYELLCGVTSRVKFEYIN